MFRRLFFKALSGTRKIAFLQENGTILGTRQKNGRKAYLYVIRDFCVEVVFQNDNADLAPETVTTFASVQEFNRYLEREFRAAF
jgi:hypothetical protein